MLISTSERWWAVGRVSCYKVNVRIIFVNGLLLLRDPLVGPFGLCTGQACMRPGHRSSFSARRTCRRFTRDGVLISFLCRTLVDFDRAFEVRAVIDQNLSGPQIPDHRPALLDLNPPRPVHVTLHTAVYHHLAGVDVSL